MDCELCDQVGGTLLWQNEQCRVVLVEDADYPGLCRVIWNSHVKEMTDLRASERDMLMGTVFAVEDALRAVMRPDKVNLASLGNLTPHLHWHVIPRHAQDKHFPRPIWGSAQRASHAEPPHDWRIHLTRALCANLDDKHADPATGTH